MKKFILRFIILIILALILFMFFYIPKYIENKYIRSTIAQNNKTFTENIQKLRNQKNITTLQELTDFDWDEVYQFLPYTNPQDIVGKMYGVDFAVSREGPEEENILFVKDGKPVCYIFGVDYDTKININIWDFSDNRNYVMYKNNDINTLIIDANNKNYISLYLPCDKNKEIYSELFKDINENDLIYSRATDNE